MPIPLDPAAKPILPVIGSDVRNLIMENPVRIPNCPGFVIISLSGRSAAW